MRIILAVMGAVAFVAAGAEPPNPFFAMDTGTKDATHATPESQAAMLAELGYAGSDHTGFKELKETLAALDKHKLKLFAIYTSVGIDAGDPHFEAGLDEALPLLKDRQVILWTPLTSKEHAVSSPEGDPEAVAVLRELADKAAPSGVRIAIYPHTGLWAERVEDAVRVVKQVDRPNVGVTFNLCHWLKVTGPGDPRPLLKEALPYLFVATINGADNEGGWDKLIQPLDSGAFDAFTVVRALEQLGYKGPIGLQGYGIGGDVHENLRRSMEAWKAKANPPGLVK